MMLRTDHPDRSAAGPHRLNLLLSHAPWGDAIMFHQLPHLLAPLGIRTIEVESGEDACEAIRQQMIHIAVIDFTVPLTRANPAPPPVSPPAPSAPPGGARVLQLLRRLDQPPPTVIVRPPQHSFREHARSLSDALREGAFAVLDRPVNLEMMLEVMRRILHRHYAGQWPS